MMESKTISAQTTALKMSIESNQHHCFLGFIAELLYWYRLYWNLLHVTLCIPHSSVFIQIPSKIKMLCLYE